MNIQQTPLVTIVVPAYNEASNLAPLARRLTACMPGNLAWELLIINDGSSDGTNDEVDRLAREGFPVYGLSLSRNFGHQKALRAGLDQAEGDCVVIMDADLQHPPELVTQLLERWRAGFQIVHTTREDGIETGLFKRGTSAIYYSLFNLLTGLHLPPGSADFRLLDRKVVNALRAMPESNLFLRGMAHWIGFKSTTVPYQPAIRHSGSSKYGFSKMFGLGLQGIMSFSVRPLRIAMVLGFIFATSAGFYGIYALLIYLCTDRAVQGWTSILISVLFCGGIQMMLMGILGEYVGKLFLESKHRPDYWIASSNYRPTEPATDSYKYHS
ncbi:MAG: glycosyltransferase family 2 protein [bacterium]